MKKLSVLCILSFVFCIGSTFGYTSEDLSNANSLADQQIIMKQTIAAKYGLDNKILRQEVIGMALKVKGITLPENYTCKKYFADATKSDWVCRAVELAADNGIITRSNKYANPGKYVTRAEALAMMMKSGGINFITDAEFDQYIVHTENLRNNPDAERIVLSESDYFGTSVLWIQKLMLTAIQKIPEIYDPYATDCLCSLEPNRLATRAEVFGFTKNVLSSQNSIVVQLTYIGENAKGGDSAYGICENSMTLMTKNVSITKTPAILKSTLESLLDAKNNPEYMEFGPWNLAGMYDLELQSVGIVNNIASVYLKHSEQTLAHATQDDLLAHLNSLTGGRIFSEQSLFCGIGSQITTLAKQFPTVQKVRVYINNVLISEV